MKDRSLRFVLFLSGYAGVPAITKEVRSPAAPSVSQLFSLSSFILYPSSYSNDRYGAIFSITESGRVGIALSSPMLSSVKRLRRSV